MAQPVPVMLLDVDGGVLAESPPWDGGMRTAEIDLGGSRRTITWAREVADSIRWYAGKGNVEIRWCTEIVGPLAALEEALGLPALGFAFEPSAPAASRDKLAAARAVLQVEGRPLVWVDDNAIPGSGPARDALTSLGLVRLVETYTERGLDSSDLTVIGMFLKQNAPAETVALAPALSVPPRTRYAPDMPAGLRTSLLEWEDCWRRAGVPVDELLAPPASEADIRRALGPLAHPDAVTWFGWCDGLREPAWFDAAPSFRQLQDLSGALSQRDMLEEVEEISDEEGEFRESWLPLLTTDRGETVFLDTATGAAWRHEPVPWGAEDLPRNLQISADLNSLVRIWIDVFHTASPVFMVEVGIFETDEARLPPDLAARRIVGAA